MQSFRLTLAVLAALTTPRAAAAQQVVADISIRQGPIAGHIVVGDPYLRQPYQEYTVEPRYHDSWHDHLVTVYQIPRGRGRYRNHAYRETRLWYDAGRDAWYDRWDDRYPGTLREVAVLEYEGRYYLQDGRDGRDWRDSRHPRDGRDGYSSRRGDLYQGVHDDHDDRDHN
jgi:hypothetical protein